MNWTCFTLLLCVFLLCSGPAVAQEDDPERQKAELHRLFELYTEGGRFRGAALVSVGGEVLFEEGFGLADENWGIPNTADTRFECASLTKAFTATTVLVLVQQGVLDLDEAIGRYLPGLREDVGSVVTLRRILSHSSGLRREVYEEWTDQLVSHTSAQLVEAANSSGLVHEPAAKSDYSNLGYVLARLIVEAVTGEAFPVAVERLVFSPSEMLNSGFVDPGAVVDSLAAGYDLVLGEVIPAERRDPGNNQGAGGMYTTVGDLERFDRALREGRLLSPEIIDEQLASRFGKWGMGWQLMPVGEMEDGTPEFAVFHNGDWSGIATHYFRYPADGFVIALLSNQSDLSRTEMFQKIVGIVNGGEASPPQQRLRDELYAVVLQEGEQAGLAAAIEAGEAGRRGIPIAMDIIQLGNTLSRTGRVEDARRVYAFATLVDPTAPWGWLGLGQWYEDAGEFEQARDCYQQVLAEDPKQPHAMRYLEELTVQN